VSKGAASSCMLRPMGRLGFSELLVGLIVLVVPAVVLVGLGFLVGYFVGKGVGFKQGLREAQQQLRQGGPPGS
jgi:UPF0716 family protein affecting phage T7 exclusion